ncbi:Arylsulfatase I (ASI) [Durusdinium trenchii]|uniref:Arylsulfatase I (ASI) n=1 Tax=Durusdinium trenchii TaxID=1381693 RepID=A0ABP0IS46_9DINO
MLRWAWSASGSCAACAYLWIGAAAKPHIIFHIIDDWGFHDIGFRSPEMQTPTLDRFHQQGITLEHYYVLPTCSPSRATFLTGRMPVHTGLHSKLPYHEARGLPLDEVLLPSYLQEEGYRTHAVGKWHLGFHRSEYTPTFRGFESFYGYYAGGQGYFTHQLDGIFDLHRQPQQNCGQNCSQVAWNAEGRYSTKLFTEEAIHIIRRHHREEPEKPLFLWQAWQNVHAPIQAGKLFIHRLRDRIADPTRRIHAAMVSAVDAAIGRINDVLAEEGMLQNSIVIATTDNGGAIHECMPNGASNYPLRGGKCSVWEGGTRGTALIYAPSVLPYQGLFRGLFHAADWLPTLLCAAGAKSYQVSKPLDGINHWPALQQNTSSTRKDVYYGTADVVVGVHGPALRDAAGWKLVLNGGGGHGDWTPHPVKPPSRRLEDAARRARGASRYLTSKRKSYPQLFDLQGDPSETTDLARQRPDVAFKLRLRLRHWRASGVNGAPLEDCPDFSPRRSGKRKWMGPWCE